MSFTTKIHDANTKQTLGANDDPSAHDTYSVHACDIDGSRVHVQSSGGARTAYCEHGHRWQEVATLDAATRQQLSEGGAWRQLQ